MIGNEQTRCLEISENSKEFKGMGVFAVYMIRTL